MIDYPTSFIVDSKSQRSSKSHDWFKSYSSLNDKKNAFISIIFFECLIAPNYKVKNLIDQLQKDSVGKYNNRALVRICDFGSEKVKNHRAIFGS